MTDNPPLKFLVNDTPGWTNPNIHWVGPIVFAIGAINLLTCLSCLAIPLMITGVTISAITCPLYFYLRSRHRWLTVLPHGFRIDGGKEIEEYADQDVVGIREQIKPPLFVDGRDDTYKTFGLCKTVIVWLNNGKAPFLFRIKPLHFTESPENLFITRIEQQVAERFSDQLRSGLIVQGKQWELHPTHIVLPKRNRHTINYNDIVRVDIFSYQVCIWVENEPKPVACISTSLRDAIPLYWLLRELAASSITDANSRLSVADGLGLQLFERFSGSMPILELSTIFQSILLLPVLAASIAIKSPLLAFVALLGFAATIACSFLYLRNPRLIVYQRGIALASFSSRTELAFDEIDVMYFSAFFHRKRGMIYTIRLKSGVEPNQKSISICIWIRDYPYWIDADLEKLRNVISKRVAAKLRDILQKDGEIRWTENLRLSLSRVEYRHKPLFGDLKHYSIPISNISHAIYRDQILAIHEKGMEEPTFTCGQDQDNFYPGLQLFLELLGKQDVTKLA